MPYCSIFVTNVADMKEYSTRDIVPSVSQEPQLIFNYTNKYQKMHAVLGGTHLLSIPLKSDLDLIALTRKGIPKNVLMMLCSLINIPLEKMSKLLHISLRTIQRKSDTDLLNSYTTEQILEIAEVITKGIEVFGTIDAFNHWLSSEIHALNGHKPIDYLDTSFGTGMLLDILGRLEHGVYS